MIGELLGDLIGGLIKKATNARAETEAEKIQLAADMQKQFLAGAASMGELIDSYAEENKLTDDAVARARARIAGVTPMRTAAATKVEGDEEDTQP